jgi:dextranase
VKRFLKVVALLVGLVAVPALAAPPVFDPATHPFIQLITTDKAVYKPLVPGNILVTLRNTTGSVVNATMATAITLNTAQVGSDSRAVSIPANGSTTVSVPFTITQTGEKGYLVNVVLTNGGTIVDAAPGAIDVQTTPLAMKYPRQCWNTQYDSATDTAGLIANHVAFHCNAMQAYDVYYRPELAPPSTLNTWPSLANHQIIRSKVNEIIGAAHAVNMPVGFFQATGEAYSNFPAQAVKPSVSWGSFRNQCGLTNSCTEADLDRSPQPPDNWTQFGWQADHLDFFDPCNPNWQQFLVANSIRPMMRQFPFDWWQADTVGAPVQTTYDSKGRRINTEVCVTTLVSSAITRIGKPVIGNYVSGWGIVPAAISGRQPYIYRETWNFDTPFVPGINALLYSEFGLRRYTAKPVLTPAYINRTLADNCASGATTSGCFVNPNSVRIATAIFAIAGSSLMNHADTGCIVTNVYVPGYQLPCTPSTQQKILDYKAFEVAYQHMLRDATGNTSEPIILSGSGVTQSAVGAAGAVYAVAKTKAGSQIIHLLNQTGLAVNDWTDLPGAKIPPTPLSNIGVKMYYVGNVVIPGTNKLWWATPDAENGAAKSLTYTTGTDSGGNFVTFTIPTLSIWDMVVLETSVVDTDQNISARQPIRGGWYADSSEGTSYSAGAVKSTGGGRFVKYRGVQFTGTAPTGLNVVYAAVASTTMTYRLDNASGPIVATCALPATGNVTTTASCSSSGATGLHDLHVTFNDRPVTLYSSQFN